MTEHDPSHIGMKGNIFGYPYSAKEADLILIPVPWDVTTSYQAGTSEAPELILNESTQLDFSLPSFQKIHTYPVAMCALDSELKQISTHLRAKAEKVISSLEENGKLSPAESHLQSEINEGCVKMAEIVRQQSVNYLRSGKTVGLVGGDHSIPFGLLQALAEIHNEFGILQIDAHMDLRDSYQGFPHSHASIMKNAMEIPSVIRLVQVGIRDYCEEEENFVEEQANKVKIYFDEVLQKERWNGINWPDQVAKIICDLPDKVYISFDMDGLDPSLCPNTGTPVPGGLSFYEAVFLIEAVVRSGREIIGFDVSETGNAIWDANVAARVLFRLCACVGISRDRLVLS